MSQWHQAQWHQGPQHRQQYPQHPNYQHQQYNHYNNNPHSPPQQQQYGNHQYANQYNAYNNNHQQRPQHPHLQKAYQSNAPPIASPFLQAQQQSQQQLYQQQQMQQQMHNQYQPGSEQRISLIPDTPPDSDDDYSDDQQGWMGATNVYNNSDNANMATAQLQLQQLVASQQKMLDQYRKNEESLKKQLSERDNHWRKTLQNSLNKKDVRINELFEETMKSEQKIKKEQMKVVELRQQIVKLRSESSKHMFAKKALPQIPGQVAPKQVEKHHQNVHTDSIKLQNQNMDVPIPEESEISEDTKSKENNAKIVKKDEKEQTVESGTVSKETSKNALNALFGAKSKKKSNDPTIESENVSKETSKNALNALFGAKKKKKSNDPKNALNALFGAKKSEDAKPKNTENSALSKYFKMKKIGMPMVSIINKMRMDGCSKELIAEFNGEKTEKTNVDLNDAKFKKYKMMKKIGQPDESIINRMRMDGLSQDEINAFFGKNDAKKPKKNKVSQMQELAIAMGLKPKQNIAPTKVPKLKRIHWKVIELKSIKGSFWEEINLKFDDEQIVIGPKFELDFQIRTRKPKLTKYRDKGKMGIGGAPSKKREKKDKITWIPGKRDQNIQIGLKSMGLDNMHIYDAIVDMDDSKMTLPRLETVYELTPDVDEQRKAEEKIDTLGDDVEYCGPSEMFHIEMSPIPEVRAQITKWLFSRQFDEIYMDRLQQVTNIINACLAIKQSKGLHCYLRIMLKMGNLMNHGIIGLESLNLLEGIKNFGGKKTLAMFLFEYAYNKYNAEVNMFESELAILKTAVRTESNAIETSIKQMADEFLNIDLFCRRLNDEYHPGDTIKFREYMQAFGELNTSKMMNLKVKIQNAQSMAVNVANYYGMELEEGRPESLFKTVQAFVDIMLKAKRQLIKLEKERQKAAAKRAKDRERLKKQKEREEKNGNDSKEEKKKFTMSELMERKNKQREERFEEEEKGNLLFHDIKMAATKFAQRQKGMEQRLSTNFEERKSFAMGKISESAQNDKIKKRLSAALMGQTGLLPADELAKLQEVRENEEELPSLGMNASNDSLQLPVFNRKKSPNNLIVPH